MKTSLWATWNDFAEEPFGIFDSLYYFGMAGS